LATPIRTPVRHVTVHTPIAYIKDNNIYFQNSEGQPIQLTHSGKDQNPTLSDDGQKIVFYRGEKKDDAYSINADGSNEQLIITIKSLPVLGQGEIRALTFVPDTHFLLFNTYLCNPHVFLYNASDCTVSTYSVDTDTGRISGLLAGLSGNAMQERNFENSPDGRYISVATSGYIDIYYLSSEPLDSHVAYQNAIVYLRTEPDEYFPRQYWLPDSSGLMAIVPTDKSNEPAGSAFNLCCLSL
jgi:Tol biopolymer transport system component